MGKNTCKLCSRRFASHGALAVHMRSHTIAAADSPTRTAVAPKQSISSTSSAARCFPTWYNKAGIDVFNNAGSIKRGQRAAEATFSDSGREAGHNMPRVKRASPAAKGWVEAEPLSSMPDLGAHAEDVAWSLLKLSRDTRAHVTRVDGDYSDDVSDDSYTPPAATPPVPSPVEKQSQFQCADCKKVFRSYQALGGHRSSTLRGGRGGCCTGPAPRLPSKPPAPTMRPLSLHAGDEGSADKPLPQECPYCGQALGGHQRAPVCRATDAAAQATSSAADARSCPIRNTGMIDLNVAPLLEEGEISAVSDHLFDPGC
ncbi:hypothetical protein ACP70R_045858 [Stipagrostis hirtigluma subsp. patula]